MADEEPRKVDCDTPFSADTIYQLINTSIQSGKPLVLRSGNLSGTNLASTNLSGADLSYADLSGAVLFRVDFSDATLIDVYLTGAKYDVSTKWPKGFDPDKEMKAGVLTPSAPKPAPKSAPSDGGAVVNTRVAKWILPFIMWGCLAGLPIPLVFWLCAILGIWVAVKHGWPRGIYGMGVLLVTGNLVRALIAGILDMSLPDSP